MRERDIDFDNPYQGDYPRWLFVCSAGMLRSATAAHHFAGRNINTRCAGTEVFAIQIVDQSVIDWADEIFVMEKHHEGHLHRKFDIDGKKITVLNIPDRFGYRDPELIRLLEKAVYNDPD